MTEADFENGYWYAIEIKEFARKIGIPLVNRLRKDQLEKIIIQFLKGGHISKPASRSIKISSVTDLEQKLCLDLPVKKYISNKETKSFLWREALKMSPDLSKKSGAWYWLNRWREKQINAGKKITYGDLVKQLVKLSNTEGRLPRIPSTRFNNFITDFLTHEKHSSRQKAIEAWEELKMLDIPKNYLSWIKNRIPNK
jgi:SAP domain-containing new25